jgi:lipoprotein-anchoring transpeptidase ErfK/SrfK
MQAGARSRLTLLALLLVTAAAPAHAATPVAVQPTQQVVALLSAREAFSQPTRASTPLGLVQAQRPITGVRTALPVVSRWTGPQGMRWLAVRLPGRPNGHMGWIRQRATVVSATRWHIVVSISKRRVIVYANGRAVRYARAIVGKGSTPTPRGEFFVEESIALRSYDVGAPFALALSARSDVLQEFDGGPGQIALHGLTNVGGLLGTAVSHGCVRLDNSMMRWLVARIGPGVPVTIR